MNHAPDSYSYLRENSYLRAIFYVAHIYVTISGSFGCHFNDFRASSLLIKSPS